MSSTYTYSIGNDTANGVVNLGLLKSEIEASNITVAIESCGSMGDDLSVVFKAALSNDEQTLLDLLVGWHEGTETLNEVQTIRLHSDHLKDGRIKSENDRVVYENRKFYGPNWCDKTSWWQGAIYVEDEVPTIGVLRLTAQLSHEYVIDTYHGKLREENQLVGSNNKSYRVLVYKNGSQTPLTESDPETTNGDFQINYNTGLITFNTALDVSDTLTVNYWYASESALVITPESGKQLRLEAASAWFDSAIEMNTCFLMEYLYQGQVMFEIRYKSVRELLFDATHIHESSPAMAQNSGWRGCPYTCHSLEWKWKDPYILSNSDFSMRFRLEGNIPCDGHYCYFKVESRSLPE
jgi:hypothetical protein